MYGERLQINPGSATGAYSSLTPDVRPSFVLMDVDGAKVGDACGCGAAGPGLVLKRWPRPSCRGWRAAGRGEGAAHDSGLAAASSAAGP